MYKAKLYIYIFIHYALTNALALMEVDSKDLEVKRHIDVVI